MKSSIVATSKFKLDKIAPYLFLILPMCVYFIFVLLPSGQAIFESFFKTEGFLGESTFVGFQNYENLFTKDPEFSTAMTNTILYTVVVVVLQNVIALLVAMLIYKASKVNSFYRLLFYLPVIFSAVTIGFIWSFIYDPTIGALNVILRSIGLENLTHIWLSEKGIAIFAIAMVHVWWGIGQGMVLFIAGLQNVDNSLLESASIDGCGAFRQFTKIILPVLLPVIGVVVVLTTIGSFKTFELVYVMNKGGADNSSTVLALQAYKEYFAYNNQGYGSAISVVLLGIVSALSIIQMKFFGKENK